MTGFPANPHRLDPYKSFKFRVVVDGQPVAGVSRVSALRRTTEVVPYREGNFRNHFLKGPGKEPPPFRLDYTTETTGSP